MKADEIGEEDYTPPPKKTVKKSKVSNLETLSSPEFNEDDLSTAAELGNKKLKKKLARAGDSA